MSGRPGLILTVFAALLLGSSGPWAAVLPAAAAEATIEAVSPRILFAVSGGYWETIAEEDVDGAQVSASQAHGSAARGYYRAIAYRAEDNTSRLYLQQIALTGAGPEIMTMTEVEAIARTRGYITDLRLESSTGTASAPGFAAFIFLKQDPQDLQPETWELFVDEFGDMTIDHATN